MPFKGVFIVLDAISFIFAVFLRFWFGGSILIVFAGNFRLRLRHLMLSFFRALYQAPLDQLRSNQCCFLSSLSVK